jgi:phage terminase large subunit GpA-like protein
MATELWHHLWICPHCGEDQPLHIEKIVQERSFHGDFGVTLHMACEQIHQFTMQFHEGSAVMLQRFVEHEPKQFPEQFEEPTIYIEDATDIGGAR